MSLAPTEVLGGLAMLLNLVAITWCAVLMPRRKNAVDRYLVGAIGMLCFLNGFRQLLDLGDLLEPSRMAEPAINLVMSVLLLTAIAILEFYTAELRNLKWKLRLTEANEAVPVAHCSSLMGDSHRLQELSHAVLESSPVAMYALDPAGAVCCWNAAAERLFGWRKSEVLGRPFAILASGSMPGWNKSAEEATFRKKDGSEFRADVVTAPVQLAGDPLPGTLGLITPAPRCERSLGPACEAEPACP